MVVSDDIRGTPLCTIKVSRLYFVRIVAHTYDAASALIDKHIHTDNYAKALEFFQTFEFTELKYKTFVRTLRETSDLKAATKAISPSSLLSFSKLKTKLFSPR